jgi:hypothetical protein
MGLCGDCVTRSIAIATGLNYRSVYDELFERTSRSPRMGLNVAVADGYLKERGWTRHPFFGVYDPAILPMGNVVVHLTCDGPTGHFSALIDRVVHDTWNPVDDEYTVRSYWTPPAGFSSTTTTDQSHSGSSSSQELTQQEFEKILRRLRALDNTAKNDASTEGEKQNALRMMQALLFQHNLSREDLSTDNKSDHLQFSRLSCVLNGSRACLWEVALANYLCEEIFPLVQYYRSRVKKRTIFQFYGPRHDTLNAIELFRELLLTIAAAAQLRFRGYAKGSGASYAEGYVKGLPRNQSQSAQPTDSPEIAASKQLIASRSLIVHRQANDWLFAECGIELAVASRVGRTQDDPNAKELGKQHGATHQVGPGNRPERLTFRS